MSHYLCALSIAGSDPSGGAGIQGDLKTFSALGCYGMAVITALTAQNTTGVQATAEVAPEFIFKQLESIFSDIAVTAVKIGMLYSGAVINTLVTAFAGKKIFIILDPVMMSKNSYPLLQNEAIELLKKELFPLLSLITPNVLEAELLLQRRILNITDMEQAAIEFCEKYKLPSVLIKGGHLNFAQSNDCLYIKEDKKLQWFEGERIKTINTHGTGCTLSAAITAFIAKGLTLEAAVQQAKLYLTNALKAGANYQLGEGQGPVHHFYQWY